MSRLGDLLLLERTRQHLTRKQVARKVGVSENYLKDVGRTKDMKEFKKTTHEKNRNINKEI